MVTTHSIKINSNKNTILSLIMNHPEISRAEITLQSGLNKATVSKTVRDLIDDSFIIESGTGNIVRNYYINDKDSPNPSEINCIWLFNGKG